MRLTDYIDLSDLSDLAFFEIHDRDTEYDDHFARRCLLVKCFPRVGPEKNPAPKIPNDV
jgi:hypothetical protein